ncbi:hypothetical protein K440DRAFT_637519 [Wilcoxina mikolae CBS 423.85]|nr:hypothetical protein K440DRAFT_637519 [Wilcoxina mikolae CBS 423.85]
MSSNFSSQQLLSHLREFHEPSASAHISAHERDQFASLLREYVDELKEEYGGYYGERPRCPKKRKWEKEEEEEEDHPDGVQELQSILGRPVDEGSIIIPPTPPNTPVPENVFEDVYLGDEDEDWEVVTGAEVAGVEASFNIHVHTNTSAWDVGDGGASQTGYARRTCI